MFSRFNHTAACVSTSFFLGLNIITLYGYTPFVYALLVDEHLGCLLFGASKNKAAWTSRCKLLSGHIVAVLLGIYLGPELSAHIVTVF